MNPLISLETTKQLADEKQWKTMKNLPYSIQIV